MAPGRLTSSRPVGPRRPDPSRRQRFRPWCPRGTLAPRRPPCDTPGFHHLRQVGSSGPVARVGLNPVATPKRTDEASGPAPKDCQRPPPSNDQQKAASSLSRAPANASPYTYTGPPTGCGPTTRRRMCPTVVGCHVASRVPTFASRHIPLARSTRSGGREQPLQTNPRATTTIRTPKLTGVSLSGSGPGRRAGPSPHV